MDNKMFNESFSSKDAEADVNNANSEIYEPTYYQPIMLVDIFERHKYTDDQSNDDYNQMSKKKFEQSSVLVKTESELSLKDSIKHVDAFTDTTSLDDDRDDSTYHNALQDAKNLFVNEKLVDIEGGENNSKLEISYDEPTDNVISIGSSTRQQSAPIIICERLTSDEEEEEESDASDADTNYSRRKALTKIFENLKENRKRSNDTIYMDNEEIALRDIIYSPSELDFKIAAQLVEDAANSRDVDFITNRTCLELYKLYFNKWIVGMIYFVVFVHIVVLPFFERPALFDKTPYWVPNLIEFVCLFIYIMRWFHLKSFQNTRNFYRQWTNYIIPICVMLIVLDLIQFIVCNSLNIGFYHRFTRPLRIIFYTNLNVGEQLKSALKNLARTIPACFKIYVLFLVSLFTFAYLIWVLFKKRSLTFPSGDPYFRDYGDGLWQLYVQITTANFPDVMMPAYNFNGFYALLFIGFMILQLYLFANMFLAAISTSFKNNLKNELREILRVKRKKLECAYTLLKSKVSSRDETPIYGMSYDAFSKLIKIIDPKKSDIKIKILFKVLDFNQDRYLRLNEFLYIDEVMTFRISEKEDRENIFEKYIPNIYQSALSKIIKNVVQHRAFTIFIDLFIIANISTIFLEYTFIPWIFWSTFIIEQLFKIYTYGPKKHYSRYSNIFDTLVDIGGLICTIVVTVLDDDSSKRTGIFDIASVFGVLHIVKLLADMKIFDVIFKTLVALLPSFITYGSMLLSVYYIVVMFLMEILGESIKTESTPNNGGVVDCSNPKLIGSAFAGSLYCKNNFNTILNAFVVMFELTVVNNWNVITSGYAIVTSNWIRLFFAVNHTVIVYISMNIVTSLILEEFWIDSEINGKTVLQTRMEKRIIECSVALFEDVSKIKNEQLLEGANRNKSLGEILETYDSKVMDDVRAAGVKFHIKSRRHQSIHMMFQKRLTDHLNIARDDIL